MKTLKLFLQEKDGGFYSSVSLTIEIPESGNIGPILHGAYLKLENDLQKIGWAKQDEEEIKL